MKTALMRVQQRLKDAGYYNGVVDGAWGGVSTAALNTAVLVGRGQEMTPEFGLAWSNKVSPEFLAEVDNFNRTIQLTQGDQPHYIMGCMAFETGRTFSPSIQNLGGAPYYGLVQWGDMAATDVKQTVGQLIKMTAVQQMGYVTLWFKPYAGKIKTLSDVYLRIFMPKFVGKAENSVIALKGTATYRQNIGLDVDKDGDIEKQEAAYMVMQQLQAGMQPTMRRLIA
jgi:hypothetical protein